MSETIVTENWRRSSLRGADGRFLKGSHISPATEFKKGIVPHNAGKKATDYVGAEGLAKMAEVQFKKGELPVNAEPLGTVKKRVLTRKDGRTRIDWVINCDWRGNRYHDYSYRKYLWEVENQQDAPNGAIFSSISGENEIEPTIEDVEIISRSELARRNHQLHWR